ncbi:MAG: DNA/RNA nuclease SfsA [Clostridia bacterium]|nr:DNA/RNA nuclease SfsA [Clostridia bacterium]
MVLYNDLTQCRFLCRVNRFIAKCEIGGRETTVHVKNTGRLGELLLPGAAAYVEHSAAPGRKTAYDLVAVENRGYVVNIDSQAPNRIVREWIENGGWAEGICNLKGEQSVGDSRFDFAYERNGRRGLIEVKGVTLFDDEGMAYFPDAPTERGVKHIRGLIQTARAGMDSGICFVLQREGVIGLRPNDGTHPAFGQALRDAVAAGVRVTAAMCHVTPDSCTITHTVPVYPGLDKECRP